MISYFNLKSMKKFRKMIIVAVAISSIYTTNAQVAINTDGTDPNPSAILDVKDTNKGFLPPRMTTVQMNDITSPPAGLMIYNTTINSLFFFDATEWKNIVKTCDTISYGGQTYEHYIGESYGGGVVFWVDHTGEHGLIVSMVDMSTGHSWSNITNLSVGTTNDWDGANNTTAIIGQSGHTNSAAKLCDDYTNADYGTGTYSDWYLPSIAELNHVWNNFYDVQKALTIDGSSSTTPISRSTYWSSSELNNLLAYFFDFFRGYTDASAGKITTHYVRAVRAFSDYNYSCGDTFTDPHDGNQYGTVQIGSQCWMKENLKATIYNNGDTIPHVTDDSIWENLTYGAYVWYENDISWKDKYGALYNWYTTVNPNGLCPTGWHVPTHFEWTVLTEYIGGTSDSTGIRLKSCRQVNSPLGEECNTDVHPRWAESNNNGIDIYGFSGFPGGYRYDVGEFWGMGGIGRLWSSTEHSSSDSYYRHLHFLFGDLPVENINKKFGHSVRCLMD